MGDECMCEKCQARSDSESEAAVWAVVRWEPPAESRGRIKGDLYLVVTNGGIALRQQSYEM